MEASPSRCLVDRIPFWNSVLGRENGLINIVFHERACKGEVIERVIVDCSIGVRRKRFVVLLRWKNRVSEKSVSIRSWAKGVRKRRAWVNR